MFKLELTETEARLLVREGVKAIVNSEPRDDEFITQETRKGLLAKLTTLGSDIVTQSIAKFRVPA